MPLFGGKKKSSYLGVDLGIGGIKMVELSSERGRAKLMTYAFIDRLIVEQGKSLLDQPKLTAELVAKMAKQAGVSTVRVVSGLPQNAVFTAALSLPAVKDAKQIKAMVELQVQKLSSLPLSDLIIDSRKIDTDAAEIKDHSRFLVTGAPKVMVAKYVEIFKQAKMELVALETEAFALVRSLVGHDKSVIMILDVGAMRTNMTIVEKGIPYLTRSVNAGGAMLTKTIAEQMGVSHEEAEQMKLDMGKDEGIEVPPAVQVLLQPILNEINYSIGEFRRREDHQQSKMEKIIITGGSAHLPGMVSYLRDKLNVNVYVGDPWARVAVPEPLRPVLDDIGPRFAVAIGLAMRDIE